VWTSSKELTDRVFGNGLKSREFLQVITRFTNRLSLLTNKKKGEKEGTQGTPEEIQGANLCEYTLEKHTNSAAQVLISIDNRANLFSVLL